MSKENQVKYEQQLPKPEKWSFDRVFGYTAGLASIGGLVGAPYVIQDQTALSNLYMGLLSFLVILLIIHAVLVEKRKLHRYAQTVFYMHYAQHLVRDALSELTNANTDNVEKVTERLLDAIANCFSITCGKSCRASVVELDSSFNLKVVARDSMSQIKATPRMKEHKLEDNTDFNNLWYSINGHSRFYLNNNIIQSWVKKEYENSSFKEHDGPEIKRLFGFTYVRNWPLNYQSALVLPIRYVSDFIPPKGKKMEPHWNYYGFLCIDSASRNSFDPRYSTELGAAFADMLYTFFNQVYETLDDLTLPTESFDGVKNG